LGRYFQDFSARKNFFMNLVVRSLDLRFFVCYNISVVCGRTSDGAVCRNEKQKIWIDASQPLKQKGFGKWDFCLPSQKIQVLVIITIRAGSSPVSRTKALKTMSFQGFSFVSQGL